MSQQQGSQPSPDLVREVKPPTPDEMRRLLVACWGEDGLNDVALVANDAKARRVDMAQAVAQRACVPLIYAQGWLEQAKKEGLVGGSGKKK